MWLWRGGGVDESNMEYIFERGEWAKRGSPGGQNGPPTLPAALEGSVARTDKAHDKPPQSRQATLAFSEARRLQAKFLCQQIQRSCRELCGVLPKLPVEARIVVRVHAALERLGIG
jgi:hypothetical protein